MLVKLSKGRQKFMINSIALPRHQQCLIGNVNGDLHAGCHSSFYSPPQLYNIKISNPFIFWTFTWGLLKGALFERGLKIFLVVCDISSETLLLIKYFLILQIQANGCFLVDIGFFGDLWPLSLFVTLKSNNLK